MKKNFLIMMIMVLCAGFTFAQNTVRGFVPGAGTGAGTNGHQTYAVFGQMFGDIDFTAANPYEVAEGLAQAQLVAKDTIERVVGCGDDFAYGEFHLTAEEIAALIPADAEKRDTFLTIQHPNAAIYNYDQLLVLHLFVCPCIVRDANNNKYEVISIDTLHCWTKSNMRATKNCAGTTVETMSYTSELVSSLNVDTFGLLYKWTQATTGSDCDSNYLTGICPCGWHLPSAAEVAHILNKNTDDLRTAEGNYWVVAENITNATKFSAQPSGYYKGLAERFEGYHSEADFWYAANDSTCTPNYFQILYYCNVPKQEYRSVDTDAMSVRCVLDMIYDYRHDIPTPNPNPNPECDAINNVSFAQPTVVGEQDKYVQIQVTNYQEGLFASKTYYYSGLPNGEELVLVGTDNNVTTFKTNIVPAGSEVEIRFQSIEDLQLCNDNEGVYSYEITVPQVEQQPTCPTSYTLIDRHADGVGLAISGDNTMVYGVTIYYEIYTGGDQPSNTIQVTADPGYTESGVSYYFANPPALTTMDDVTKIVAKASVSFLDDYNCTFSVNPLTYYEATNNACPTYGDVNIVNNEYKIPVGNYTPSATTQDVFTVTCVYDIGSVGQSQIVERTGNIYYNNGFVFIGLGNDVPANYCGLTFKIKLNGACEKSVLYSYCY